MKDLLLLLIIYQFLTTSLSGQIIGEVIGKDIGEPLIGVTIVEKHTENGVVTDIEGKFKLKPIGDNPILEISYTGYITKELKLSNFREYQRIELEIDSILIKENIVFGCIFHPRYSLIGLSGGINSTTLGFRLENVSPHLLRQRIYLISSIEWRKSQSEKEYIEILLRRYNFPKIGGKVGFNIAMALNKIKTDLEGLGRINRQYALGEFSYLETGIGVGLTRQKESEKEDSRYGLQLRIYKNLFRIVNIDGGIEFFKEKQYFCEVRTAIPRTGINIGIKYRQIRSFEDYEVFVGYRFDY